MSQKYRRTKAAIAGCAALVVLAACSGGGSTSATEANSDGLVPVKVGVLTTATNAPIFMGVDHGFFKDAGLDVQLEVLTSGATTVPSLMSDSLQFAYTGSPSVLIARSKGLPTKLLQTAGHQPTLQFWCRRIARSSQSQISGASGSG